MSVSGKPKSKIRMGRDVIYRSKTGRYSLPAKVSVTQESIYQASVDAGLIHPLSTPDHVHLVVFTGGSVGGRLPGTNPAIPQAPPGGTYQEFDIPWAGELVGDWEYADQPPGTWAWPNLNR